MSNNGKRTNGYYDEGEIKYFENGDFTIYQSQYNVGREIITRAENVDVLSLYNGNQKKNSRVSICCLSALHTLVCKLRLKKI